MRQRLTSIRFSIVCCAAIVGALIAPPAVQVAAAQVQVTAGAQSADMARQALAFLPNEVWRLAVLMLVHGLDEKSQIIVWVRAVATAMLAGVLAQLILSTSGPLASIPVSVRIGASVLGFAAFLIGKRSVFAGVLTGEAAILLGTYFLGT